MIFFKNSTDIAIGGVVVEAKSHGMTLTPEISYSTNYIYWESVEDWKRCEECANLHGKIYSVWEKPKEKPPIHPWDRCELEFLRAVKAGTATINGQNGADFTLFNFATLPEYYVTEDEALAAKWKHGKWPINFVPDKMITMGVYANANEHLPVATGRVWYEADINYVTGKRNNQRVIWSNDGLVFVTYDHYETFIEVI